MKLIKENLALLAAIAGVIAALTARIANVDEKFVYNAILVSTSVVVLLGIWLRSHFDGSEDLNVLSTFITDNLPPNRSKKFLGLKTEVVVIADKDSAATCENFVLEFQSIKELKVTSFVSDGSDTRLQIDNLRSVLAGAEAVIIVRTEQLEKQTWVYETLDAWASQNSHVPCLVIDRIRIDPQGLPPNLSAIPERYFFIPDDKKSLPWRMLKRANERAFAWRNQASFNRMIALAFLVLVAAVLVTSYFSSSFQQNKYETALRDVNGKIEQQPKENYRTVQEVYMIMVGHTKEDYEDNVTRTKDDKLNLSYWVINNGTYYPLSSTEKEHSHRIWRSDESSIIGCAFAHPNSAVQWNEKMLQPQVVPFNGEATAENSGCHYGPELQRKLPSIVCASFSRSADANNTVGICVFTENKGSNMINDLTIPFLRKRSQEFYESIFPLMSQKKLIPIETEQIGWRTK